MATLLDLITDILQTIGELGEGQTPSPEDGDYVMRRVNGALDSMSQEEGFIYNRSITSYALTANTGTYAIGPTAPAPFNTARPTKIDFARILINIGGTPVGVKDLTLIPAERYASYSDKTSTSIVPEELYYDNAAPLGNLSLFDIPSADGTFLELTAWTALQQFTTLMDPLVFPPGYYEMLVTVLGVAVSPAYNKPVDPVTAGRAETCTRRIKEINHMILRPGIPMPVSQQGAQGQPQAPLPQ